MIVVVQYYTSNLVYGKYTREINEAYCSRNGYTYHLETDDAKIRAGMEDRAPTWYKPKIVLEVLDKYNPEAVLFIDADAVFFGNNRIEEFLIDGVDIVASEDHGPSKLNAGVLLFRNTEWTRKFLHDWWEMGNEFSQYKQGLWHDQTCFGLLMNRTLGLDLHIRIISNRVFNARDTHPECFIFHAFSYGHLTYRTLDVLHAKMMNIQSFKSADSMSQLAAMTQTDKYHTHQYIQSVYEEKFDPYRTSSKLVVEIGVYQGESLRLWRRYFPFARIVGVDINLSSVDGCEVIQADQSKDEDLIRVAQNIDQADLIIDDGSHRMRDQQRTFYILFKALRSGGLFVLEDLHTSIECLMPSKSWCNWGDPTKTTTLNMLNEYIATGKIRSDYLTEEECRYLEENIRSVEVFAPHEMSVTSTIYKK